MKFSMRVKVMAVLAVFMAVWVGTASASLIDGTWRVASGKIEENLGWTADVDVNSVTPQEFPMQMVAQSGGTYRWLINDSYDGYGNPVTFVMIPNLGDPGEGSLSGVSGFQRISAREYRAEFWDADYHDILTLRLDENDSTLRYITQYSEDTRIISTSEYTFTRVSSSGCNVAVGALVLLLVFPVAATPVLNRRTKLRYCVRQKF